MSEWMPTWEEHGHKRLWKVARFREDGTYELSGGYFASRGLAEEYAKLLNDSNRPADNYFAEQTKIK